MAGFTALSGAVSTHLLHPFFELASVWIGMATGAGEFIPVKHHSLGLEGIALFVTIATGNRFVTAR